MIWPAAAAARGWSAIAGRNAGGGRPPPRALRLRARLHRLARAGRRRRASSCSTTAGRTTCTPSRRSPRPRPASTSSARSRSAATPTRPRASGGASPPAGVKHMCAFNYRFVPAVRLARELIEAGELGEIYHFRGALPAGVGRRPGLPDGLALRAATRPGSGALGDLGAHIIDLAPLPGRRDRRRVSALTQTFIGDRAGGTRSTSTTPSRRWSSSRTARSARSRRRASRPGRKNALTFEINGSKGSIAFDLERLNELRGLPRRRRPRRAGLHGRAGHARPTTPSGSTGGRTATSSAGSTPSSTSCTTCSTRSSTTATSPRTAPTSRTATAPPWSATRSSARREHGQRERLSYRSL